MAAALRKTYADLFQTYTEPLRKSRETLENFFAKGKPSLKKYTLGLYVDTFKTLCEFADFKAVPPKAPAEEEKLPEVKKVLAEAPAGLTINLNIQLTLPVTEDAKVYDAIFKSLKENLLA